MAYAPEQNGGGDGSIDLITDHWKKTNQRIYPEAKLRSRHAKDRVHHLCHQIQNCVNLLTPAGFFFGRQYFHFDRLRLVIGRLSFHGRKRLHRKNRWNTRNLDSLMLYLTSSILSKEYPRRRIN